MKFANAKLSHAHLRHALDVMYNCYKHYIWPWPTYLHRKFKDTDLNYTGKQVLIQPLLHRPHLLSRSCQNTVWHTLCPTHLSTLRDHGNILEQKVAVTVGRLFFLIIQVILLADHYEKTITVRNLV